MAKCDEGYRCDVCGRDVEAITESDLYLRYVLGEIPLEVMHRHPERHIRCNPGVAQYIVHRDFSPVNCDGDFAKANFDLDYVRTEESRVTAGWSRLQAIPTAGLSLAEYPLHITPVLPNEEIG
ncbi:hypothetical protein [Zavarzinella formosa]|uniref:hypothetical protein n=1 Tax=Zavarzinella formosa TaxID=360055 RepID=UPI0002F34162|nr:hypothetical protein [Zavarzinella formosa]